MGKEVDNETIEINNKWADFDNTFVGDDDEEENASDKIKKEVDAHEDDDELDEEEETEEIADETEEEIEDESAKKPDKAKTKPQSKEQSAIIALKREKKELEAKLAAAEAEKEAKAEKARNEIDDAAEIKRLVDEEGLSESLAKRQVASDRRAKNLEAQLERDRFERKLDKMEKDYPGISDHADEIWKLTRSGLTPAEVYKARYADVEMSFDKKTKAEQEVLARQAAAKSKATVTPGAHKGAEKDVKLSSSDERAFQLLKKKDPTITRKAFAKWKDY